MRKKLKTILVVDDDENDLIMICRAFQDNAIKASLQTVSSGSEAISYLMGDGKFANRDKYPFPSFIMTDLKMDSGDGFEVLQHLQMNPEWAIIPTVVLSASEDPDDIKKSYLLGASSYHVKPGDYYKLRAQLRILYDYWETCSIPEIDSTGRRVKTDSKGKLGERFPQPSGGVQARYFPTAPSGKKTATYPPAKRSAMTP